MTLSKPKIVLDVDKVTTDFNNHIKNHPSGGEVSPELVEQKVVEVISKPDSPVATKEEIKKMDSITINALHPPANLQALHTDGVSDNTKLLSNIISYITTNYNSGTIYIPYIEKDYIFDIGDIIIPSNIRIYGSNSKLKLMPNAQIKNFFLIKNQTNVSIENFQFIGTDSKHIAVHIQDACVGIHVVNCTCDGVGYLVKTDSRINTQLSQNIYISKSNTINTIMPCYFSSATNIYVDKCNFIRNDTNKLNHQFYINSYTSNIYINECVLEGGHGRAIDVKDDLNTLESAPKNINVTNTLAKKCDSFIVTEHYAEANVSNCICELDTSLPEGIAFACFGNSKLTVDNCKVLLAKVFAGGISNGQGHISISNTLVYDITLQNIRENFKSITLNQNTFNEATKGGFCIWNVNAHGAETVHIANCTFNFKTVQNTNDLFKFDQGSVLFDNCTFNFNIVPKYNFVFNAINSSNVILNDCNINTSLDKIQFNKSNNMKIINCYNGIKDYYINTSEELITKYSQGTPIGVFQAPIGSDFIDITNGTKYIKVNNKNTDWSKMSTADDIITLKSPNNTKYQLSVADDGTLSATLVQ